MGIFRKFKEIMQQNKETDIEKMKFQRFTGFVGSVPQNFADKSLPVCPVCKKEKPWLLHVAQKTVKVFPVTEMDHTYHIKCENCGLIVHTVLHQKGENMSAAATNPSPADSVTLVTIDVAGNSAENADLTGKTMSIAEFNKLA